MDDRLPSLRDLFTALPGSVARARSLAALLDEVADIQWQHPVWWALVGGTAVFERYGAPVPFEQPWVWAKSADHGARIDTFMGRERAAPGDDHARIARAVVRARAALDAIAAVHGTLPGQPLQCHVRRTGGWLERPSLTDTDQVAFLTESGAFLGRVTPGREAELALQLLRGRLPRVDPWSRAPTHAAVAVSLVPAPLGLARHIHRQTWSRAGGPWLGIADAPPYEVASTCHVVLDGHGHGVVSAELFRRIDALAPLQRQLVHTLAQAQVTTTPRFETHAWRDIQPMGVASAVIHERIPFAEAAYALGRTMALVYMNDAERRRARYTPTFLIPVAPRSADEDPVRRRRRVLYGLAAVRMHQGEFEPFDRFRARLRRMIARVMDGQDVLIRLMQAAVRVPTPRLMKQRYLGGYTRPNRWSPANLVLAGRGMLSCMRFTGQEFLDQPIVAASSPSLGVAAHDPRGSTILTLVQQRGFCTATVTGSGLAASQAGAQRVLDIWRHQLA